MSNLRKGRFGNYYGSYWGESEPLTQAEMNVNARYIYSFLIDKGWTINAICGMLGNMQAESTLNPGRWQSEDVGNISLGYGLVQWTPSTNHTQWASEQGYSDPSEMDTNLIHITYEVANKKQWIAKEQYNFSFEDFTKSSLSVGDLAKAFLLNYERPKDQSISVQEYRASLAQAWYSFLANETPTNPDDSEPSITRRKKKKFNFILFNQRRREQWIN